MFRWLWPERRPNASPGRGKATNCGFRAHYEAGRPGSRPEPHRVYVALAFRAVRPNEDGALPNGILVEGSGVVSTVAAPVIIAEFYSIT